MKKLLILFLLFLVTSINAQDTIVRANGEKIPANIADVNNKQVTYRLPGYPDGPLFTLDKSHISSIWFRNNTREIYSDSDPQVFGSIEHRSMISLNTVDLSFGMASVSWERNMCKDKLALRIPLSFGITSFGSKENWRYNYDRYYYTSNKYFSSGVDLLYYPLGQQHVFSYYCGISSEVGYTKMTYGYFEFPPYGPSLEKTWYGAVGVINGVLINVNERMSVSPYLTIGAQMAQNNYPYYSRFAMVRGGINMGYRFGHSSFRPKVIKDL